MLSAESEVLMRHLPLFDGKSLLLFGFVQDNFAAQCGARAVNVFSLYYDYAARYHAEFGLDCASEVDLAVYYWTKNKGENQYQLLQWLSQQQAGQECLIVGENRAGVRSVEKMLGEFGEIGKIDSARRCSLYHFRLMRVPVFDTKPFWRCYTHGDLAVHSLPAVFSAAELDAGTALLLSTFSPKQPLKGKVLDLGAGAGVIGAQLKKWSPAIALTQSDIHAMALKSCERTLAENGLTGRVVASDVFSAIDERFDLIVSNPPFHSGVDTAYEAVEALIAQAKAHLLRGGELRIVANAFLPYPALLDRAFGTHNVLAKTTKFVVYSARA